MSLPEILGFGHSGRGVGVRDHQLILPSVVCSTRVSRRIAAEVGAVTLPITMDAESSALMLPTLMTFMLIWPHTQMLVRYLLFLWL